MPEAASSSLIPRRYPAETVTKAKTCNTNYLPYLTLTNVHHDSSTLRSSLLIL